MRIPHVNTDISNRNRQFKSFTMGMRDNEFGVIGMMNNATKLIGFVNNSTTINENDVDEEEEEDIDADFSVCNEKLCKDNENKYDYFFVNAISIYLRIIEIVFFLFFVFLFVLIYSGSSMNINVLKRCFDNDNDDESSDDCPQMKRRRLKENNKNQIKQPAATLTQQNKCDKSKMNDTKCAQDSQKRVFNHERNMDDCFEPLMKRRRLNVNATSINEQNCMLCGESDSKNWAKKYVV